MVYVIVWRVLVAAGSVRGLDKGCIPSSIRSAAWYVARLCYRMTGTLPYEYGKGRR